LDACRGKHPLKLLRTPDGDNTRTGGSVKVRADHVEVPVILVEPHHRNAVDRREIADRLAEPITDLGHDRR
jgi:hypothetical protein